MENSFIGKHHSLKKICEGHLFVKQIETFGPGHNFSSSCCAWDQLFESKFPSSHLGWSSLLDWIFPLFRSPQSWKIKPTQERKTKVQCTQTTFLIDHLRPNDTPVNRVFPVLATKPQLTCSRAGDCPASSRRLDRWLPESPPAKLLWSYKCLSGTEVMFHHTSFHLLFCFTLIWNKNKYWRIRFPRKQNFWASIRITQVVNRNLTCS